MLISRVREALVRRPSSQPALAPHVTRNTTRYSTSMSSRPLLIVPGWDGGSNNRYLARSSCCCRWLPALVSAPALRRRRYRDAAQRALGWVHSYIRQAEFRARVSAFCARVSAAHAFGASTCTCASRVQRTPLHARRQLIQLNKRVKPHKQQQQAELQGIQSNVGRGYAMLISRVREALVRRPSSHRSIRPDSVKAALARPPIGCHSSLFSMSSF